MSDNSGKVAFVTGASSGIGLATASAFAKSGYSVALVDIQEEAGRAAAKSISAEAGAKTIFLKCDVANKQDVAAAVQSTVDEFGRLDCAFNNAGIEGTPASTVDCTDENFDRTININLKGVWHCMRYQIPVMLKQGGGNIVNCASIAGLVGFENIPAYVASKHGVVGLTKTAALEYAKSNIRVNAVCPGLIATPMIDRFTGNDESAVEALKASEPIGRMGRPEEIAAAVLFLCSDQSSFVTGHPLAVDGGWVAK